ncbi:pilin [Burkholderia cenocepacia]|uniref:pilin n=1 Tax=Burkholderia cenocepacia TaxID=95486 RepID=UPI00098093CF|nr:pilin [Burkholderia cenocepacia]
MKIIKGAKNGFTLIELMITVAIIGILAAIALPAYQNYTIRAQVSEGILLSEQFKTAISEYYANNGKLPATQADVNVGSPAGKYSTMTMIGGSNSSTVYILTTFGNEANQQIQNKQLTLMAQVVPGVDNLQWTCKGNSGISSNPVPNKFLPISCQ